MKKFFEEFKKFITRGNVIDLAVGVIIGGAFTAIVTAVTSNILQPLINALISVIFGDGSLAVYTVLVGSVEDLSNSIYIDWGAFISAVINFFLIAIVLFIVVRAVNRITENNEKLKKGFLSAILTKQDKKEMKEMGLNPKKINDVKEFRKKQQEQIDLKLKAEEEEKKKAEEEAKKHSVEGLLEEIVKLLEQNSK